MRKFFIRTLLMGALAAVAIAFGTPSAVAAGTWSVVNPNADGSFSGPLSPGTSASIQDVNTSQSITCEISTISGFLPSGTGLDGTGIPFHGSFTCTGPLGSTASGTFSGFLNFVSYDPATDTVSATITDLQVSLSINSILGTCNATLGGEIDNVTYNNKTGTLTVGPDPAPSRLLVVSTSGACAGLINVGDTITFTATYNITPIIIVRPDDA